jgi:hypothetical protein
MKFIYAFRVDNISAATYPLGTRGLDSLYKKCTLEKFCTPQERHIVDIENFLSYDGEKHCNLFFNPIL